MTMILTSFTTTPVIELSGRLFRKQIIKYAEIDHKGQHLVFDTEFGEKMAASFKSKPFGSVPFVMADADNKHTMDPERARGRIIDVVLTPDGVDGIIEANNDETAKFLRENPDLGVSVRVYPTYERTDGVKFDNALQHVLGTFEPALPGMKAWEAVEASADNNGPTIDLSGSSTMKESNVARKRTPEEQDAILDRLETFLEAQGKATSNEPDGDTEMLDTDEDNILDGLSEQEIADLEKVMNSLGLLNDEMDEDSTEVDEDERQPIAASYGPSAEVLELTAKVRQQDALLATITKNNARLAYERERDQIVQAHGIPPTIVEMARPLLEGDSPVIALSANSSMSAGDIVRALFKEIGKTGHILDLSMPASHPYGISDEEDDVAKSREDKLSYLETQYHPSGS